MDTTRSGHLALVVPVLPLGRSWESGECMVTDGGDVDQLALPSLKIIEARGRTSHLAACRNRLWNPFNHVWQRSQRMVANPPSQEARGPWGKLYVGSDVLVAAVEGGDGRTADLLHVVSSGADDCAPLEDGTVRRLLAAQAGGPHAQVRPPPSSCALCPRSDSPRCACKGPRLQLLLIAPHSQTRRRRAAAQRARAGSASSQARRLLAPPLWRGWRQGRPARLRSSSSTQTRAANPSADSFETSMRRALRRSATAPALMVAVHAVTFRRLPSVCVCRAGGGMEAPMLLSSLPQPRRVPCSRRTPAQSTC